jgi:SSS family solute:Na+ symporter
MNLHWIDWTIVFGTTAFFVIVAYMTKQYVKSTADFLSANRCAGRYLLTMSDGSAAGLGLITIMASWQLFSKVGFAGDWWANLNTPISLVLTLTAWVIYRYRETRVMTLAQFFEVRYSRRFRIVAGCISWISGIINFGIFPAVAANFFTYFCGLSEHYFFLGITFSTYYTLIITLTAISLYFTFIGGQIAIMVTDFFQSIFCNIVLLTIVLLLLFKYPLSDLFGSLLNAEEGKSMVNPLHTGQSDFDPFYFIVLMLNSIINRLAWQGSQGFSCSAKSPHEAKMAGALGQFRGWGFAYALMLVPIVGYMMMHNPDYAYQAGQVTDLLCRIGNDQVRDQMLVPMTMTLYLPVGLLGAFAAVMLAAHIGSNDVYLHSWGSIFVQDIIIPLRRKPFSNRQHIWALRLSIIFVAVFICVFSCLFRQTTHILYFMAITGAIWMGGIGVVITAGLYTSWGKTTAAYAALICGSFLAGGGLICEQFWMSWYGTNFTLPGQFVYIYCMILGVLAPILAGRIIAIMSGRLLGRIIAFLGILAVGAVIVFIEIRQPNWAMSNMPWQDCHLIMNGQRVFFFAMATSIELYILISLSGRRNDFNLDKMLHRGQYRIASEHVSGETGVSIYADRKFSIKKAFGITEEFTLGDKIIYGFAIGKTLLFFVMFAGIAGVVLLWGLSDRAWADFFYYVYCFMIVFFFITTIWLSIGGFWDLRNLFRDLRSKVRDLADDGRVSNDSKQTLPKDDVGVKQ